MQYNVITEFEASRIIPQVEALIIEKARGYKGHGLKCV